MRKMILLLLLPIQMTANPVSANHQNRNADILTPTSQQTNTTHLITEIIINDHYKSILLNDELSEKILASYLSRLDPHRQIFKQEDIAAFAKYKQTFDNALREGNLQAVFDIYSVFRGRLEERVTFALNMLRIHELNFKLDEDYYIDREHLPWANDNREFNEIWRKRIKNDYLNLLRDDHKSNEILATLETRYLQLQKRTSQHHSNDVYHIFILMHSSLP